MTNISEISGAYVYSGTSRYAVSADVMVFISNSGSYYQSTIDDVANTSKYSCYAYYDKNMSSGGRIRCIIATAR